MYVYVRVQVPREARGGCQILWAGVTGSCEPHSVYLVGPTLGSSRRAVNTLNHRAIFLTPYNIVLKVTFVLIHVFTWARQDIGARVCGRFSQNKNKQTLTEFAF